MQGQNATSFYRGSEKHFTFVLEQLASDPKVQHFLSGWWGDELQESEMLDGKVSKKNL